MATPPDLRLLQQELEHWHRVVQARPQEPNHYVWRGMVYFKLAEIAAAIQDFDRAEALQPAIAPYLWQRGLAYYYADRFAEGASQFELDLSVNANDVEETVWRYLCLAQLHGTEAARASLLPVGSDSRPIMASIYRLFAGTCTPQDLLAIAAHSGQRSQFYAHLYLGLYAEAAHDPDWSAELISKAVHQYPQEDYMWYLGVVHLQLRGWLE